MIAYTPRVCLDIFFGEHLDVLLPVEMNPRFIDDAKGWLFRNHKRNRYHNSSGRGPIDPHSLATTVSALRLSYEVADVLNAPDLTDADRVRTLNELLQQHIDRSNDPKMPPIR